MATWRLRNPKVPKIKEAITRAVADANQGSRSRTVYVPVCLVRQILGSPAGIHQSDGGAGPPNAYREVPSSSLFVAWWTTNAGDKLVLIDGRRIDASPATPDSARGVPDFKGKPEEAIRGWRKRKKGGVESVFQGQFADLGRMPAADPTHEALLLAALFGDRSAQLALHDYEEERKSGSGD